jgi:hypothetical protein
MKKVPRAPKTPKLHARIWHSRAADWRELLRMLKDLASGEW